VGTLKIPPSILRGDGGTYRTDPIRVTVRAGHLGGTGYMGQNQRRNPFGFHGFPGGLPGFNFPGFPDAISALSH
jgi:hypothetical protein